MILFFTILILKNDKTLTEAHRHCAHHRPEIENSRTCACFDCGATFSPIDITLWIDDGQTALCPHCGMDCVLGDADGYELTPQFLELMRKSWM